MNSKNTKKKGRRETSLPKHSFEDQKKIQSQNDAYKYLLEVITSDNSKEIQNFLENWDKNAPFDLEELLSRACQELRLQNVCLSDQVEYVLEKTLLNCRLSNENVRNDVKLKDIKDRISLIMETTAISQLYSSNLETFIFSLTFIAKQIHILKRLLKSTYDRLPWEELEFCIISFVRSFQTKDELNFFSRTTLNGQSITKYLQFFVEKLIEVRDTISNIQLAELSNLPFLKRDDAIGVIKKNCPGFENLYKDYAQIRDMHSLNIIWQYSKLVSSVNPAEKKGQLVIIRALQVIGEHLKNTLESPKISKNLSDHLVLSLNEDSRKIVISLRNSLSHGHSLSKRIELLEGAESDFFKGIQNDVNKIGGIIEELLFNHKILTMRKLMNRFLDSKDLEEMKEIASIFECLDLFAITNNMQSLKMSGTNKYDRLRGLIETLCEKIPDKSFYTANLFQKIDYLLKDSEFSMNYAKGLAGLLGLHDKLKVSLKNDNNVDNSVRTYKFMIKQLLGYFMPSEKDNLKKSEIFQIILLIYENIKSEENIEVTRLMEEIFQIVKFETDDLSWVEKFETKLDKKKSQFILKSDTKENSPIKKRNYKQLLDLKIEELKKLRNESNGDVLTYSKYKKDSVIQVAIEALLLDIYSIEEVLQKTDRPTKVFFLDSPHPLVDGKNLRNHLAHYNELNEILFNPILATFVNMEKFIQLRDSTINEVRKYSYAELKKQYNDGLSIITQKQQLFSELQEGDLDNIKALLEKGASIKCRDTNSSTCMHFASQNPNIEILKYLNSKGLDFVANLNLETPLHMAAASGNTECVKYILSLKSDSANVEDNFWRTPLHRAAFNGQKKTIEILIKQETSLYNTDMMCFTALHYAVLSNNKEAVKLFFSDKINRKIDKTQGGLTALHIASENGMLDMVTFLLDQNVEINAKSDIGGSSIHVAAFNGHLEVVEVLIKAGADVNTRSCNGLTPLHHASEKGFESVVELLLKHGADVDPKDHEYQFTPLNYVTQDGHLGIVKILLSYKADVNSATKTGSTPLHFATKGRHLEIVNVLVKHPCINVNSEDIGFFTPLHVAANNGDVYIGKVLLENGAKFDQNSLNDSPLHLAAREGHEDFLRMLLDVGMSINVSNSSGSLPIHCAAESGNAKIISMLLGKGADINSGTNDGSNCLHIAARYGKNIVDLLIKDGISVNSKTNLGFSPLHEAVAMNYVDIVISLIEAGANLNCQNNEDSTVLHIAAINGFEEIVKILLEKQVSINIKNKLGMTALTFAIRKNQKEIVRMLVSQKSIELSPEYLELATTLGKVNIVKTLLTHPYISSNKSNLDQALFLASTMGHTQIVHLLIQKGARPNNKNNLDIPPLIIACSNDSEDIAESLLASGANINSSDLEGTTALHIAAKRGNIKIVQLLLDQGMKLDILDKKNRLAIELAACDGHVVIFKQLLDLSHVNINRKGNDDFTLLHIAAQFGHFEIIEYLINKGANMNLLNNLGSKPIHIAAREGFPEIIKLFLDKGMKIDDRGSAESSLLHYAAYAGKLNVMEFLLEQKFEINSINILERTALHLACSHSQTESVKYLLNKGAIFNKCDISGDIPKNSCIDQEIIKIFIYLEKLFSSIKLNNLEEIEDLVRKGVILNAIDEQKGTPLHFAVYKGLDEVVKILLENKASPNLTFKNGWTALHYATKFERFEIVQLLLSYGAKFDVLSNTGKAPIDFTNNASIKNLLTLIKDSFSSIQRGKIEIVQRLNKIKDIQTIRAIMSARNVDGKNLISLAIQNNFTKIEQLECILQPDVKTRLDVADSLLMHENYHEALKIFIEVYEQRRIILGNDNPATLEIQANIALVYYKQQKYLDALNLFEIIYQKQVKIFGVDSGPTLSTRSRMALVLHRQGKNKDALIIFEEVHEGQTKILEKDDQELLGTKCHMALVLMNLNKFEEASKLNREVLELQNKKFGALHPVTLSTKNNLALALHNQGQLDEALRLYQEVYEARVIILGPYHSDTMRCLHNKIGILSAQKKYEESLNALKLLYDQQKLHLGLKHRDTLNTAVSISDVLMLQGKLVSAYKFLDEIKENLTQLLGSLHPEVLRINTKMAAFSETLEKIGVTSSDMGSFLENLQISMYKAAKEGDTKTIEGLLKSGVDVNLKDKDGRSALHFAVDSCDSKIIKFLLTNGAKITETTNMGNSVLHLACTKESLEIVEIPLKHVSGADLHHFINIQTNSGKSTALHVAAKKNHVEIVKVLLRKGAIYDVTNRENQTPKDLSTNIDIIGILQLITDLFNEAEKRNFDNISTKLKELNQGDFSCVANARNVLGAALTMLLLLNGGKNLASTILARLKCDEACKRN